jgi:hypothetical protein
MKMKGVIDNFKGVSSKTALKLSAPFYKKKRRRRRKKFFSFILSPLKNRFLA